MFELTLLYRCNNRNVAACCNTVSTSTHMFTFPLSANSCDRYIVSKSQPLVDAHGDSVQDEIISVSPYALGSSTMYAMMVATTKYLVRANHSSALIWDLAANRWRHCSVDEHFKPILPLSANSFLAMNHQGYIVRVPEQPASTLRDCALASIKIDVSNVNYPHCNSETDAWIIEDCNRSIVCVSLSPEVHVTRQQIPKHRYYACVFQTLSDGSQCLVLFAHDANVVMGFADGALVVLATHEPFERPQEYAQIFGVGDRIVAFPRLPYYPFVDKDYDVLQLVNTPEADCVVPANPKRRKL